MWEFRAKSRLFEKPDKKATHQTQPIFIPKVMVSRSEMRGIRKKSGRSHFIKKRKKFIRRSKSIGKRKCSFEKRNILECKNR